MLFSLSRCPGRLTPPPQADRWLEKYDEMEETTFYENSRTGERSDDRPAAKVVQRAGKPPIKSLYGYLHFSPQNKPWWDDLDME